MQLAEEATRTHLLHQKTAPQQLPETVIRLFYYRFFFPDAVHLESSSADPKRSTRVPEWLGIRVGEYVTMNQVVARCTDRTLMLSRLVGIAIDIGMKVGRKLSGSSFSVIDPNVTPMDCHATNMSALVDSFNRGALEPFVKHVIDFTDINGNPPTGFQVLPTRDSASPAPYKSPQLFCCLISIPTK